MKPRAKSGFVYLIEDAGEYKIGHSKRPSIRLSEVADPAIAKIVHLIPSLNAHVIEKALHRRFNDVALGGEWFALTDEDVAAVCALPRTDTLDDLPKDLYRSPESETVRIAPDLMEMLQEMAYYSRNRHGKRLTVSSIFARLIKPQIEADYARARQIAAAQVAADAKS